MSRMLLSQLGLDKDADERAVKRAYAALLKGRRPDDDAARFQQLHEVYEAALRYVRSRAGTQPALPRVEPEAFRAPDEPAKAAPRPVDHGPIGHGQKAQAYAPALDEPFDAREFFESLLQVGQQPEPALQAWLQAHPALYSIQRRSQLVPSLVLVLESADKLPTPEGLERLLAFFGLDQVDRRSLQLQPRLEKIRDVAFRQHQVIVGPDMSFMYPSNGELKPRPTSSSGWQPVVPVFLILISLSSIARCVGNADQGRFETEPYPAPAKRSYEMPRSPSDDPPWRYVPPVPVPPAPADNDPD